MSRWRATVDHPVFRLLAAVTGLYLALLALWPAAIEWATSREGPVEQLSHALLVAVALAWGMVVVRVHQRVPATLGLLYVLFLLLEEIDWGAIYGWDLGHRWLSGVVGSPSLHALGAAQRTFPLADPQVLIALPAVAYFAYGLLGRRGRTWEWLGALAPRREDGVTFFGALGVPLAIAVIATTMGQDVDAPRFEIMGTYQAVVYALLGAVAVRAARSGMSRSDS